MGSEAIKKREVQALNMIEWYKGRDLPKGDIKLAKHVTITDVSRYVARSIAVLQEKRVYSREFVASYYRLSDLKKHIEACKD